MSYKSQKGGKSLKIIKGKRKIGIISKTYSDLKAKCSTKFHMEEDKIIFSLEDGTEIDEDYFDILENNDILLIKQESYTYRLLERLENFLLQYIANNSNNVEEKLRDILNIEDVCQMLHSMISFHDSSLVNKSSRLEDSNWFKGLDTKYKNKEEVLKNSAESRMRGYFQKMKKDMEYYKNLPSFVLLVKLIQEKLKINKYHSHYFDRSEANAELRLCTDKGLFHCFGDFESPECPSNHVINPYKSREERIMFSTWNFDHVIEKSRSIIPLVKAAIEESPNKLIVSADYLFELLFKHYKNSENGHVGNLKLVNIVCHNKNPHNLVCDKSKLINESSEPEERHKAKKIRV